MSSLLCSMPNRRSNAKPFAVQPRSCISVSLSTACAEAIATSAAVGRLLHANCSGPELRAF